MSVIRTVALVLPVLLASCSSKVDGPTPQVTGINTPGGTNVICTCDAIDGCVKQNPDLLTIAGAGFSPLPVLLLTDQPGLELPDLVLRGPQSFTISGKDPGLNPTGVGLRWKNQAEMELTLPPDYVKGMPPGKYEVEVVNPNGNAASLKDGLEVVLGPRVTRVAPETICPTIDQPVTITGENLRAGSRVALIQDQTTIEIPAEKTRFDEKTGTLEIVIAKNTVAVGDYDLQVILAEGCAHTLKNALHMIPPPTLESVEPAIVCIQADRKLILKGKDFRSGASVSIDGPLPPADVRFIDATQIEITVRAGLALGKHDLTVTNPEGCPSTLVGGLTVVPPPTLSAIAPGTVCSGGKLTLTGTGFLPGASVSIGTALLTGSAVTVVDDTKLEVEVGPITPGGPYDVRVQNADGCSSGVLAAALIVTPGPIVVAVDPGTVYSKVDFPIAIFGSGFGAGLGVSLGTVPPTALTGVAVNASGDRVDAIVPKGIAPGTYDLTVKDSAGCSYTLKLAVKVIDQLTLTVCGIDPPFGYTGEKTAVTITSGTPGQLGCPASATSVQFASTPRAWLEVGGVLKAIRSVAFVTATSLTGTIEAGLTPGGPYDLLVQNPDGQIGVRAAAFKVVDKPVPLIEAINPGSVDTQFIGSLTITGKSFRAPVSVELISVTGTKTALTGPTATSATQASGGLNVGTAGLGVGAYLVRLTNTDQGTYYDFSSLAITNPAGNLTAWQTATSQLGTARRRHAMAAGRVSAAARFLYVIGGDPGGASPAPIDTVELVPLDKFGNTGSWVTQRNKLPKARTGLSAFVRGRYLHVLGGNDGTAPVKTVSRAEILDPAEAPELTSFTFSLGGMLGKGAWYYRVAAILPANDPDNPGGETLCSDPVVIQAIDLVKVSLTWKPVASAVSYNIYRTPAANGVSGGEQLLKSGVLPATACTTTCSFEDSGLAIENAAQTPLPLGATGVFVEQGIPQLTVARSDAALTLAPDPAGALHLYLAGGRSSATALESTIERCTVSSDGASLGPFVAAGSALDTGREKLLLVVGEHGTSPSVPSGSVYLVAAGGTGAAPTKDGASMSVANGGALGPFTAVAALKSVPVASVGYLVNNTFYYFGGASDGQTASSLASSCELTTPPAFKNCNSLAAGQLPAARMHAGLVLESAFFYLSGGGATATAASKDVIKTPW